MCGGWRVGSRPQCRLPVAVAVVAPVNAHVTTRTRCVYIPVDNRHPSPRTDRPQAPSGLRALESNIARAFPDIGVDMCNLLQ
ncbi:hypothetical protein C8Q79DRAFT_967254 [Trametes meyenii]|nr:hypothetical protein C8Q79DRAFT_967254 [Trametes meyenii]